MPRKKVARENPSPRSPPPLAGDRRAGTPAPSRKEATPHPSIGLVPGSRGYTRRGDSPAADWRGGFPTAPSPTQYPDRLHHAPKKVSRENPSPRSSPPLAGDRRAGTPAPSRKEATPHPSIQPFPGPRGYPPERRLSCGRLEGRFSYRPESDAVSRPPAPCPEKGIQGKPVTPLLTPIGRRQASRNSCTFSKRSNSPSLNRACSGFSRIYKKRRLSRGRLEGRFSYRPESHAVSRPPAPCPKKRYPGKTPHPAPHPHWPATGEPVLLHLLEKEQLPIPQSGLSRVLADIHRRGDSPAADWRGGFPTAPSPTQYPDRLHHAPKKVSRENPSPRSSPPLAGDRRAGTPAPSRKEATPHPPIRPFPGSLADIHRRGDSPAADWRGGFPTAPSPTQYPDHLHHAPKKAAKGKPSPRYPHWPATGKPVLLHLLEKEQLPIPQSGLFRALSRISTGEETLLRPTGGAVFLPPRVRRSIPTACTMPRKRYPGKTPHPAPHPHCPATGEPELLHLLEKKQLPIPQSGLFRVLADIHRREDFPMADWRARADGTVVPLISFIRSARQVVRKPCVPRGGRKTAPPVHVLRGCVAKTAGPAFGRSGRFRGLRRSCPRRGRRGP